MIGGLHPSDKTGDQSMIHAIPWRRTVLATLAALVLAGGPATAQEPTVPRPYGTTITVVYNQLNWGVNTISMDSSRTCPD